MSFIVALVGSRSGLSCADMKATPSSLTDSSVEEISIQDLFAVWQYHLFQFSVPESIKFAGTSFPVPPPLGTVHSASTLNPKVYRSIFFNSLYMPTLP